MRVETLAKGLGVSKGGFYWHFADRNELLAAMLDEFERLGVDEIVEEVDLGGGDARTKLRRLFVATATPRFRRSVELAVRDWARGDRSVAKRLRRIDNRRMNYLRSLFGEFCRDDDEVEVRCLLTFSMYVGSHYIAADHPTRRRSEVIRSAGEWLLA